MQIDKNELYAWCIVPYDAVERSPEERISMLKALGFQRYAYDWRADDLDDMAGELTLAAENGIEVVAVWLWIDKDWDRPGKLNDANRKIFSVIREVNLKTQLWVGFHPNYFEDLTDSQAVAAGAEMIGYLASRADELGCKVALYNHGDWFGEPANQVKIIQALPERDIGIVYNFHHAHHQLDYYPQIVESMLPYLWSVNLNGMRKRGPKILPIGKGDEEERMLSLLFEQGFTGPFGILGHVEDRDVEDVLRLNLTGLEALSKVK